MVKPTPSRFNPDLLARDSTQFGVNLPLAQFSRLSALLLNTEGEMQATFRFSKRKEMVLVSGNLKATVQLECQRCLEGMQHSIDEPFELVFAKSLEAAQDLPESMDPVVLDDNGQIHVVDLFEDELILHLPTVARHEQVEQCNLLEHVQVEFGHEASDANDQAMRNGSGNTDDTSNQDGNTRRPFDILKNLDLH